MRNACDAKGKLNATSSNSNIIAHFKTHHPLLHSKICDHIRQNSSPQTLGSLINAHKRKQARNIGSMHRFLETRVSISPSQSNVSASLKQHVGMVLFACKSGMPLSSIGSPLLQGLVNIYINQQSGARDNKVRKLWPCVI